jgi:hypothetical protein
MTLTPFIYDPFYLPLARVAATPISFAADGQAPIVVVVEAKAVKSRSNIQNN